MKKPYRLLKKQVKKKITHAKQAAKNHGAEICGLLVDNGYFLELIQVKNISKRGGSFRFCPKEVECIEKSVKQMDHAIVGTFHSHPYAIAKPGDSDIAGAFDDEIMLIIDVLDADIGLWSIKAKKAKKLRFKFI